jgi:dnd system-associated protein 4
MSKQPDRLFVRKEDIEDFKLLQDEKDSPFCKRTNKDVFFMAMLVGLKNGVRLPLQSKQEYVREEYLNDDERTIIKSIAISEEKDLSVLVDKGRVYQIAEEYAAGGIKYLKNSAFKRQHGSYVKELEGELLEEFEKTR